MVAMGFQCSAERPWGIHQAVRNDEDCPRCGWTAPGPKSDAREDALADAEVSLAIAAVRGWVIHDGGQDGQALAA
jgi:hypothetical protein